MKKIYLDYASITPIDPLVRKEMDKWNREPLNPSSIHSFGVKAKKSLDQSHKEVASFLNAHADEIVFTSGGTEANSLAIEGVFRAAFRTFQNTDKTRSKPHLIISVIEHSSIIEIANMLEKNGVEVTRLEVDKNGLVSLDQLKKALKPETFLVSIMTVNNEIGTIEPIKEIAKIIRDYRKVENQKLQVVNENSFVTLAKAGVLSSAGNLESSVTQDSRLHGDDKQSLTYPIFHTDACQAVLYEELNVEKLGIDLLTLDASKACGPRGVGALFVKRRTPIEALIHGGGQEKGLRSGTENIPGIVGFVKALKLIKKKELTKNNKKVVKFSDMGKESRRVLELRDYFEREVKNIWSDAIINGAGTLDTSITSVNKRSSIQLIINTANLAYRVKQNNHGDLQLKEFFRIPHISNITFPGIDAEMLVLRLDAKGIFTSTKSACLKDEDESYVLRAIGADSKSSIRFSFGRWTKKSDINETLNILKNFVQGRT